MKKIAIISSLIFSFSLTYAQQTMYIKNNTYGKLTIEIDMVNPGKPCFLRPGEQKAFFVKYEHEKMSYSIKSHRKVFRGNAVCPAGGPMDDYFMTIEYDRQWKYVVMMRTSMRIPKLGH